MAVTLLTNGQILGGSSWTSWAPAMLVAEGEVLALGDADRLAALRQVDEVIDLGGRTVLPGFIDSHAHPVHGGEQLISCGLSEGETIADYRRLIEVWSLANPDPTWIVGGGWSMDAFPGGIPSAADLDGIGAGRPIFLMNRDGHSAWVNQAAMERAGITGATSDPAGGRIEHDESGRPSGALHELAADLVRRVLPAAERPGFERSLRAAHDWLLSIGITSWEDAGIRPGYADAYRTMLEDGTLVASVEGAQWLPADFDDQVVSRFVATRESFAGGQVRMGSVKIMLDGVVETHTAHLKSPYLVEGGQNLGIAFFDDGRLREVAVELDALGFNLHFHAVGDAALRQAIDTVAACRLANGVTEGVHHVAHVQVVDHADLVDMRRVGLAANAQTLWARNEPYVTELAIPFLGPERGAAQYPFASFLQRGVGLGMGSDWPVSTALPFHQLHVAVNRLPVPKPSAPQDIPAFAPWERLTLIDAVRAFTIGSATLCRLERTKGSLEPGKDADFVVLDTDPFAIDPAELYRVQVVQTWVRGRLVAED